MRWILRFFAGVRAFFGGLGFIVSRPSMWGWALVPVFFATLIFFGLGALTVWGGSVLSQRILWDPGDGAWTTVGVWTLRVLMWLVGLVIAFVIALSLAQPLSGFALDAIARRQELALGGRAWPNQPILRGGSEATDRATRIASLARSLRVTVGALAVSLPILAVLALVTFLFPPASVVTVPLKFVVAGMTIAYDFLDYPLSLRGAGFRSRMGFIRDHFWAVAGFGLSAAALLLVPGIGLLVLPFGVAGATRLVVESDQTLAKR